jgi:hypothetical protein
MATCVYSFSGIATTASDLKSAELNCLFTPPPTLDELCYVECTSFTWDYTTDITTVKPRDTFTFTTNLGSQFSGRVSETETKPAGVAFGTQMNSNFYSTGPVLCRIPSGPQTVRFTITRVDGGVVANDVNSNTFFCTLKIVPANARQPTIGV